MLDGDDPAYRRLLDGFQNQVFSVCSALGGLEQTDALVTAPTSADHLTKGLEYVMGDECMSCLRDLKRYIREDDGDPARHVLRWLGDWSILQRDLLPILELNARTVIKAFPVAAERGLDIQELTGEPLAPWPAAFDDPLNRAFQYCVTVLELVVVLTWYLDKADREQAPWFDRTLRSYKLAFASHPTALPTLVRLLRICLARTPAHRSPRERVIINGCLLAFRNLLEIPDPHASVTSSGELFSHGQVQEVLIAKYQASGIYPLVLRLAGLVDSKAYVRFQLVLLDIFYLSFKDVLPAAVLRGPQTPTSRITDRLEAEKRLQALDRGPRPTSRHSRFGGTYVVQSRGGLGGGGFNGGRGGVGGSGAGQILSVLNAQTVTQPLEVQLNLSKRSRQRIKAPTVESYEKTRHPFQDRRTFATLDGVARAAVASSLNTLLAAVGGDIELRRPTIHTRDTQRYLYVTAFFMEYVILLNDQRDGVTTTEVGRFEFPFKCANTSPTAEDALDGAMGATPIAELVISDDDPQAFQRIEAVASLRGLAIVIRSLVTFRDDKETAAAEAAVGCLKQMLRLFIYLSNYPLAAYRELSDHVLRNLCYEESTLDLIAGLGRDPALGAAERSHAAEVFELLHLYLRILEYYTGSERHFVVRKKERVRKKKPKPVADRPEGATSVPAVGEELTAMPSTEVDQMEVSGAEDEEDDGQASVPRYVERELQLHMCEKNFAREALVKNYCRVLAHYRDLPASTIYHIIVMLHRLGLKLGFEGLFFKLSTLELFNSILIDQKRVKMFASLQKEQPSEYASTITWSYWQRGAQLTGQLSPWIALLFFVQDMTRQFFRRLKDNSLLMVEAAKENDKPRRRRDEESEDGYEALLDASKLNFKAFAALQDGNGEVPLPTQLTSNQKLGATVGLLLYAKMEPVLVWLQLNLDQAIVHRETAGTGGDSGDEEEGAAGSKRAPQGYPLVFTDQITEMMQRNAAVRQILELLDFRRVSGAIPTGQDSDGESDQLLHTTEEAEAWIIPGDLSTDELKYNRKLIRQFTKEPLGPDGQPLKKARKPRKSRRRTTDEEDENGEKKKKRKPKQSQAEAVIPVYKSAQFVLDSDDDADGDEEFYRREAAQRKQTEEQALQVLKTGNLQEMLALHPSKAVTTHHSDTSDTSSLDTTSASSESDGAESSGPEAVEPPRFKPGHPTSALTAKPKPPTKTTPTEAATAILDSDSESGSDGSPAPKRIRPLERRFIKPVSASTTNSTDAGSPETAVNDERANSAPLDVAALRSRLAAKSMTVLDSDNGSVVSSEEDDERPVPALPAVSRSKNVYQSRRRRIAGSASDDE
ncbi:Topoisomerase 1-associated factor 1 [Tieghemiomyces parasiticus]|uniref:Topoisomerase 1-associated factor 1 n=1 Tax=Tieghemiomyces parasiticus TaxID=78921 RepID=A0A9W8A1J3_9FUNG|nr:Topoisomerase 1-associated factor 1 [Tieghemiomyces parasiticus]